jgi:hypothetical protein
MAKEQPAATPPKPTPLQQPPANPDDCIGAVLKQMEVLSFYLSRSPSMEVNGAACIEHLKHMAHWLDYLSTAQAQMSVSAPSQAPQQPDPARPN